MYGFGSLLLFLLSLALLAYGCWLHEGWQWLALSEQGTRFGLGLIVFLGGAFGFTVRLRIANHRIQMNVGDGAIVLTELRGEVAPGQADPERAHSVMVRVEDVDAHWRQAAAVGARVVRPPETYPYGERQYTAIDFAGRAWTFSESIADVDPGDWGGDFRG